MTRHNVKDLVFSQSALGTYSQCYLKFRRRYIDGLYWPGSWVGDKKQRESIEKGNTFHLLANRYYSGLPLGVAGEDGQEITQWLAELVKFRPKTKDAVFMPEQVISYSGGGIRLTAKFDLLMVLPDGRGIIFDWKTTPGKPKPQYYSIHIQTIVYRYILAVAGGIYSPKGKFPPQDISMIYWNPRHPGTVHPLAYSQELLQRDQDLIVRLIYEIENRKYEDFYATGDQGKCVYCEYSPICHGRPALYNIEDEEENIDLGWDDIDEFDFSYSG